MNQPYLAVPALYRFADLELDVGLQRLTRAGVEVPLPKLSFELLLALVEAAPNVVPQRRLLARVWPGVVVGDKTVSQRVKLLRDALGDDPEDPRYVLVLRGRGYRVKPAVVRVSPVETQLNALAAATVSPPPALAQTIASTSGGPRSFPRIAIALLGLAAFIALGIASYTRLAVEPATPAVTTTEPPSIAVLPFRDLGDDPDNYLALGIPEIVIDRLGTIEGFRVIARTSSLRDWGDELQTDQVARQLDARYLVSGSVQRIAEQLRVTAQLLDSSTGAELWAQSFDRSVGDIFSIQDEIAEQVAAAVRAVNGASTLALRSRPTTNVDAYLAYLRGRAAIARWNASSADIADTAFSRAIDLDPTFSAAYAALYDARMMAVDRRSGGASPRLASRALDTARTAHRHLIDRALELDPASGAGYFARATWANDAAPLREQDFRRGLELEPSNGRGVTAFAEFLDRLGRRSEADRMIARALEIDPLSPRAYFWSVQRKFPGNAAGFAAGMPTVPDELEAGMLAVLELDPDYLPALQRYAKYRWQFHGDVARSIQTIEHALTIDPHSAWLTHTAVAMYLDVGATAEASALNAAAARPEIAGGLLLQLHAGDLFVAGESAFDEAAFANGPQEAWGVVDAVHDWALAQGDSERALEYLRAHYSFESGVGIANFRAVPAIAGLLLALDRAQEARDLLGNCIGWIDSYHVPRLGNIYALRVKAKSLLLLGETDLALDALDASFRANDYLQWWYTLERDPDWSTLRSHPRFVAIEARVRQHVATQAAELEALRRQGAVPARASGVSAPAAR